MGMAILISLTLFGAFFFVSHVFLKQNAKPIFENQKTPSESTASNKPQTIKTVLEINGQRYEDEIASQKSVYDFMSKLRNEGKINFTEKNYTGMGKFIETINGVKGNGGQNWIYYVNGKEAQVGVSNYKINPGDVVSWKYEKSNY